MATDDDDDEEEEEDDDDDDGIQFRLFGRSPTMRPSTFSSPVLVLVAVHLRHTGSSRRRQ